MLTLFYTIAIVSGFFGIILLIAPKLYASIAKNLSKTVVSIESVNPKLKAVMGILLIIVSILTFYIIHLQTQTGLM